jgi:hypothetical protein
VTRGASKVWIGLPQDGISRLVVRLGIYCAVVGPNFLSKRGLRFWRSCWRCCKEGAGQCRVEIWQHSWAALDYKESNLNLSSGISVAVVEDLISSTYNS